MHECVRHGEGGTLQSDAIFGSHTTRVSGERRLTGRKRVLTRSPKTICGKLIGMLVIRTGQLSVFEKNAFEHYEQDMVRHVEIAFPGRYAGLGPARAAELVHTAIRTGLENGIRARAAITVLLDLMLQYGEQFELAPDPEWALKILRHPTLPAHLKVDTIRDRFDNLLQGRRIVLLEIH